MVTEYQREFGIEVVVSQANKKPWVLKVKEEERNDFIMT